MPHTAKVGRRGDAQAPAMKSGATPGQATEPAGRGTPAPIHAQDGKPYREGEPWSESIQHVDFGGYYLTHAIWHNSYGSYQPETGVRSHADGCKAFRLIEHGCNDWPLVTVVTLAALSKGWDAYRIGNVIGWLHARNRARRTKACFAAMHDNLVHLLSH